MSALVGLHEPFPFAGDRTGATRLDILNIGRRLMPTNCRGDEHVFAVWHPRSAGVVLPCRCGQSARLAYARGNHPQLPKVQRTDRKDPLAIGRETHSRALADQHRGHAICLLHVQVVIGVIADVVAVQQNPVSIPRYVIGDLKRKGSNVGDFARSGVDQQLLVVIVLGRQENAFVAGDILQVHDGRRNQHHALFAVQVDRAQGSRLAVDGRCNPNLLAIGFPRQALDGSIVARQHLAGSLSIDQIDIPAIIAENLVVDESDGIARR